MNYKHIAYVAGGAIVAISIAVALALMSSSPPEEIDSVGSNVDMIGNGKNVSGVHTESVQYAPRAAGFLAAPGDAEGKYPGIVMIHEWWGLNDNIKSMAEQMATHGYVVLAVDLYDGQVATETSRAQELAGQVRNNPESAIQNLKAAVTYLKNHESVNAAL